MSNEFNMNMVILAEKQIDNIHKDHKDPFNQAMASVWVLNPSGDMTCRKHHGDVYELLGDPATLKAIKGADMFGILTCGWAAQIENCDDDTPPSQAKGRRRVRLFVAAFEDGAISVLRFKDNADEIITDDSTAKGSLADAVMDLYQNKKALEMLEGVISEN